MMKNGIYTTFVFFLVLAVGFLVSFVLRPPGVTIAHGKGHLLYTVPTGYGNDVQVRVEDTGMVSLVHGPDAALEVGPGFRWLGRETTVCISGVCYHDLNNDGQFDMKFESKPASVHIWFDGGWLLVKNVFTCGAIPAVSSLSDNRNFVYKTDRWVKEPANQSFESTP